MSTNIEINYLDDSGSYEILYPLASFNNMTGSLTESQIPNLSMSKITSGNLSASRISGTVANASNSTYASRLSTGRTLQTDLGKTSSVSFDGSSDIEPGIKGVLGIANGGTGSTSLEGLKTSLGVGGNAKIDMTSYIGTGAASNDVKIIHDNTNTQFVLVYGMQNEANINYNGFRFAMIFKDIYYNQYNTYDVMYFSYINYDVYTAMGSSNYQKIFFNDYLLIPNDLRATPPSGSGSVDIGSYFNSKGPYYYLFFNV